MIMNGLSPDIEGRSNKILATILSALASVGQNTLAEGLGVHESTVSDAKTKRYPEFAKTLVLLGLKVVPVGARCYAPETIEPLLQLAKQRMAQLDNVKQLEWDE